jgi:hypothetical protein
MALPVPLSLTKIEPILSALSDKMPGFEMGSHLEFGIVLLGVLPTFDRGFAKVFSAYTHIMR